MSQQTNSTAASASPSGSALSYPTPATQFSSRTFIQPETPFLRFAHTKLRDKNTKTDEFQRFSDIIIRSLIEFALNIPNHSNSNLNSTALDSDTKLNSSSNHLSPLPLYCESIIQTPTNSNFNGLKTKNNSDNNTNDNNNSTNSSTDNSSSSSLSFCCVSILRAGESMESPFRQLFPSISIGKILIQRNELTAEPKLYYMKLPQKKLFSMKNIFLLDPMLATGGSASMAIRELLNNEITIEKIIFINIISAPEGIKRLIEEFPLLTIVTGYLDYHLNEHSYIIPGVGDYGDRYFGTVE